MLRMRVAVGVAPKRPAEMAEQDSPIGSLESDAVTWTVAPQVPLLAMCADVDVVAVRGFPCRYVVVCGLPISLHSVPPVLGTADRLGS